MTTEDNRIVEALRFEVFANMSGSKAKVEGLLSQYETTFGRDVKYLFYGILFHISHSQTTLAKEGMSQLRSICNSTITNHFLEGMLWFHMGERKKGKNSLRQLCACVRNQTDMSGVDRVAAEQGLLHFGKLLLESKRFDEGLGVTELLCLTSSGFLPGWELYGDFLLLKDNSKDAISCYERCQQLGGAVVSKLANAYYSECMFVKCLNLYLCDDSLVRDKTYDSCKLKLFTDVVGMCRQSVCWSSRLLVDCPLAL